LSWFVESGCVDEGYGVWITPGTVGGGGYVSGMGRDQDVDRDDAGRPGGRNQVAGVVVAATGGER
jgi:hypothetical protein